MLKMDQWSRKINQLNKNAWERFSSVKIYIKDNELQPPEIKIIDKYKYNIAGKKVLDIGCGTGRTTHHLAKLTNQIIGIDYSEKMIAFCKAKYPDINFITCDVRDLSALDQKYYDFVLFSFNGLDNLDHMNRIKALKNIFNVLNDDGIFVFSTHNINHYNWGIKPYLKFSSNFYTQIKNIVRFSISVTNYLKNRKYKLISDKYAILNDSGSLYALFQYYIDKQEQVNQLKECKFETLDIFDQHGNNLSLDQDDSRSAWIYYVVKKCTPKYIA